jgi:hypothetical protein
MVWAAIDRVRQWAGQRKDLLAGLAGVAVEELAGCVPGGRLAVRVLGELARYGLSRLLAPAAEVDEVQPAGPLSLSTQYSVLGTQPFFVSGDGRGHFRTIADALRHAPPGACVVVRPGVYRERLVLTRPVAVVGEGGPGAVVVESTDSGCVRMETDHATVRGLALRCRAGARGGEFYAVDVPRGRLVLEECDITSDSLACVAVRGPADPVLRRCRIRNGRQAGVYAHAGARGTLEDCDIAGHANPGVALKEGADPLLRRCTVRDGRVAGVLVYDGGKGRLEDCAVVGNALAGVAVKQGGDPLLRRCRIRGNGRQGVWVYDGGAVTAQGCDLTGNARGPWHVEPACTVWGAQNRE